MPERSETVLLLLDFQVGVVDLLDASELLEQVGHAAEAARAAQVPIVWSKVGMRRGTPEISPRNQLWSQMVGAPMIEGAGSKIVSSLSPRPSDLVADKKRTSAFVGSDLEIVLRAAGVRSVVLAGIFTSGAVLSTLLAAADLDFELTVLSDACGDPDEEVHRVLVEKVFPRQATVMTASAWSETLAG